MKGIMDFHWMDRMTGYDTVTHHRQSSEACSFNSMFWTAYGNADNMGEHANSTQRAAFMVGGAKQ